MTTGFVHVTKNGFHSKGGADPNIFWLEKHPKLKAMPLTYCCCVITPDLAH